MGDGYFQLLGNPDEIGQRRGFHLLHDPATVDLKRHLADSSSAAACMLSRPLANQQQDFSFAGGEDGKTLLQLVQLRPLQAGYAILTYCRIDRLYQLRMAKRFDQKIDGAGLHRPHGRRNIAMSGNEYDGGDLRRQSALETPRPLISGSSTSRTRQAGRSGLDSCHIRWQTQTQEHANPGASGVHKRFAQVLVIVHDEDDLLLHHHGDALESAAGANVCSTALPPLAAGSASSNRSGWAIGTGFCVLIVSIPRPFATLFPAEP